MLFHKQCNTHVILVMIFDNACTNSHSCYSERRQTCRFDGLTKFAGRVECLSMRGISVGFLYHIFTVLRIFGQTYSTGAFWNRDKCNRFWD